MKRTLLALACILLAGCQSLSGGTKGRVYVCESNTWKPDGTHKHSLERGIEQRSNAGVLGGKLKEPLQEASVEVFDAGAIELKQEQMFTSGDNAEQARMAEKITKELTPVLLQAIKSAVELALASP
jgi:hypothetical protein